MMNKNNRIVALDIDVIMLRGWYYKPAVASLFLHMLFEAVLQYRESAVAWGGDLITSVPALSADTGLSANAVRKSLNGLKRHEEIDTDSDEDISLISILNFGAYCGAPKADQDIDTRV